MTHARHPACRSVVLAIAALLAALALLPSAAAAQEAPPGAWYGWGAKFRVENGAPVVTFITYVAEDGTRSGSSRATTHLATASSRATAASPTTPWPARRSSTAPRTSTRALPSWEEATSAIGYDLPDTGECMVCAMGGAPIWGDMGVTPRSGSRERCRSSTRAMPALPQRRDHGRHGPEPPRRRPRPGLDPINTYRSSTWDIATSPPPAAWSAWRATASSPWPPTSTGWATSPQLAAVVQSPRSRARGSAPGRRGPPARRRGP